LGQGLVPSLARPGGNLTGIALPPYSITAKLVEILNQIAPDVTRVALALNPANPSTVYHRQEFEAAAAIFAVRPIVIEIKDAAETALFLKPSRANHREGRFSHRT
jgi:putative ABC transport system substrate-binding protein